jgi:hypothetical protein
MVGETLHNRVVSVFFFFEKKNYEKMYALSLEYVMLGSLHKISKQI